MKINNSSDVAVTSGKWKNPGASFYDKIMEEDNYKLLLKEAYLTTGKITKDIPYSRSGCKYPHHTIKNGELVVSKPGVMAAYSRARQMGVFQGKIKNHLMKHIKELGITVHIDEAGEVYLDKEAESMIIIEENFHDINLFLMERTGINLFEDDNTEIDTMNESWIINLKDYCINMDKWCPGNPLWITGSSGDGKSTLAQRLANENKATIVTSDILLIRLSRPKKYWDKLVKNGLSEKDNPHKLSLKDSPAMDYALQHPELPYDARDPVTTKINNKITRPEMLKFYKWCMNELSNNPKYKDTLYIIEGCDICFLESNIMAQKPLIITGGSKLRSLWRRAKRDSNEKDRSIVDSLFKYIKQYESKYKDLDDNKDNFLKSIKDSRKNIKDNPDLFEESIEDLGIEDIEESVSINNKTNKEIQSIVDTLSEKEKHYIGNAEHSGTNINIYRDIIYKNNEAIAFLELYKFKEEPDTGYICLAIKKNHRGSGYAKQLVRKVIDEYRRDNHGLKYLGWLVDDDNKASNKLAQYFNFKFEMKENHEITYKLELTSENKNESVENMIEDTGENSPQALWKWMHENISYDHSLSNWHLKSPNETYTLKTGNCHDQSFFASYILHSWNIPNWQLFFVEFKEDDERGGNSHTLTYYKDEDNKYYWLENAWEAYAGIHGPFDSIDDLKDEIVRIYDEDDDINSGQFDGIVFGINPRFKIGMNLHDYVESWELSDDRFFASNDDLGFIYYRVEYDGVGVYEALRQAIPMEDWKLYLSNGTFSWLPKPPSYADGYQSWFTKEGYFLFLEKVYPLIQKYLDTKKIQVRYKKELEGKVVYQDPYQVVIDLKDLIKESIDWIDQFVHDDYFREEVFLEKKKITENKIKQNFENFLKKYKFREEDRTIELNGERIAVDPFYWLEDSIDPLNYMVKGGRTTEATVYEDEDYNLHPLIILDKTFFKLPPRHMHFTLLHELGHIKAQNTTSDGKIIQHTVANRNKVLHPNQDKIRIGLQKYALGEPGSDTHTTVDEFEADKFAANKMKTKDMRRTMRNIYRHEIKNSIRMRNKDIQEEIPEGKIKDYHRQNNERRAKLGEPPLSYEEYKRRYTARVRKRRTKVAKEQNKAYRDETKQDTKQRYKAIRDPIMDEADYLESNDIGNEDIELINEYDPPYSKEDVIEKYGIEKYNELIQDPAHKWRMETGIELIHKEPTLEELERIYNNWQLMTIEMKEKSDAKSIELFGKTNEEHYKELILSYSENLDKLNKYTLETLPDIMYFAAPKKKTVLSGKKLFLTPYIGIASIFVIDTVKEIAEEFKRQTEEYPKRISCNTGYDEWNLDGELLNHPLKKCHIIHNIPGLKNIFKGKSTGYIHFVDISKIKNELKLFVTNDPDREVYYEGGGLLTPIKVISHTIEWEMRYSEEKAKMHGQGIVESVNYITEEDDSLPPPIDDTPPDIDNLGNDNIEDIDDTEEEKLPEYDPSKNEENDTPEDPNKINRRDLYQSFIQYAKSYHTKNIFSNVFDKDVFEVNYPFIPEEMQYFYRQANPMLCVLDNNLTFFSISELNKMNEGNNDFDKYLIFASDEEEYRIFNLEDKGIYLATDTNGNIELKDKLANSFDEYIQIIVNE